MKTKQGQGEQRRQKAINHQQQGNDGNRCQDVVDAPPSGRRRAQMNDAQDKGKDGEGRDKKQKRAKGTVIPETSNVLGDTTLTHPSLFRTPTHVKQTKQKRPDKGVPFANASAEPRTMVVEISDTIVTNRAM